MAKKPTIVPSPFMTKEKVQQRIEVEQSKLCYFTISVIDAITIWNESGDYVAVASKLKAPAELVRLIKTSWH